MRTTRFALVVLIATAVLQWNACSGGSSPKSSGGGGNPATYVVGTDAVTNKVLVAGIVNGALTAVPGSPFIAGATPTMVASSPDGKFIYVINNGSNSVSQFQIAADGSLTSPQPAAPSGLNVMGIAVDSMLRFVAVANQGSNTVSIYGVSGTNGALTEVAGSPFNVGIAPVAVAIGGNFIYAASPTQIAEIVFNPGTTSFSVAAGSPFVGGVGANYSALFAAGTNALYAADAANNQLQAFNINQTTGNPSLGVTVATGTTPMGFATNPSQSTLFVANKGSNNISAYTINSTTGALTPLAGSPFSATTGPTSMAYDPTNNTLFVNSSAAQVGALKFDSVAGTLTPVSGSPISVANPIISLTIGKP